MTTNLGRHPERGRHDFETIAAILDEALICHVGLVTREGPVVLPTIHARIGDTLYIHGSPVARWMKACASGMRVCVTVSILDGLVLARSAYHHSLNYRSAVLFGNAEIVSDPQEKLAALRAVVEHVCSGRWNDVRHPTDAEMRATLVVRLPIVEASAKTRTGPPEDLASDKEGATWAGVIPIRRAWEAPIAAPDLAPHIPVPEYCQRPWRGSYPVA